MLELVIIRGVPGTGKTTLARQVFVPMGYVHCEADMFFAGRGGTHPFSKDLWPQAHNWCKMQVCKAMRAGRNVVVTNTFTQHWQYQSYLNLAHAFGYQVRIISLTREYGSVHHVPAAEMERIRGIWEE
jgi:predicted kinase